MKKTPINMGECIIEPFWDSQLSGIQKWVIGPGKAQVSGGIVEGQPWWEQVNESIYIGDQGYRVETDASHNLSLRQTWCNLSFEWLRKPMDGLAMTMSRDVTLTCDDYTHMIISVLVPNESKVIVKLTTDIGELSESFSLESIKSELSMDLKSCEYISRICIEIWSDNEGISSGRFDWIGLKHEQRLEAYRQQFKRFDSEWYPYLKPATYEPRFSPEYGFIIQADKVESLRSKHQALLEHHGSTLLLENAKEAMQLVPEEMVNDYVNFWNDTRYCRVRDNNNVMLKYLPYGHGVCAAVGGILMKDAAMLRQAARFGMALAMSQHWDDGMICDFPGSNFEHKAFVQHLSTQEIVLILDLAWDYFTPVGRQYIMRRIGEEGVANINWMIWKHTEKPEEIMKMNQFAWFSTGRIMGHLMLEKSWKLVESYTDLAYEELKESMDQCIFDDGGFGEGPLYFGTVATLGGLSFYHYAMQRNLEFDEIIPDKMKLTADFAEILLSIDEDEDMIRICDCAHRYLDHDFLGIMATLLPDSHWTTLFYKALNRSNGLPQSVISFQLMEDIPDKKIDYRPFIQLPEMGIVSSCRSIGDEWVKLFIMANKANIGHNHEDKGSFVLEFAGETFAMDPGACDYSLTLAGLLKYNDRHNMLVPLGIQERPHPEHPLPYDMKPICCGDELMFEASLDVTKGYEIYYKKWCRSWKSSNPNQLTIIDDYILNKGTGVEFLWNTDKEIIIDQNKIELVGKRGLVILTVPTDCTIKVDVLPLTEGRVQKRIAIINEKIEDQLQIDVELKLINCGGITSEEA